ncbi:hypothetical protein [Bailinhaonella thermotolerans]|uniref:DUF8094 domain-containing protein n=1 Tax=Bailinhaonella thermotolerans TaxID=1070861 RepID=A0A3A4B8H6_9ACTN|nr:hypothetical protein [Bailinhaonella thermotolerans]RJL30428.1 hypothetical protein D5H75_22935 [Bailinhaonella thermotolerans]
MKAWGAAIALLAAVCAAAACTAPSKPAATVSASATGTGTGTASPSKAPPEQTDFAEAGRVVATYFATDDVARATGDERLGLALARDGRTLLTMAAFRAAIERGTAVPRARWGRPRLMIPKLDRYPLWFAAAAERREAGASRTAVMVFMKADDEDRWRLSSSSLLESGEKLPELALDADGYATPLATFDDDLAISPRLLGPLHATIAEEGAGGAAAGLVAPGPHTTARHVEIQTNRQRAKESGMGYDSIFGAANFPVYALKTEDGGGLVFYVLSRTTTWYAKAKSVFRIEPPPGAVPLLKDPVVRRSLEVVETQQYVATVPPKGGGAARVIAYDGAITKVNNT